MVRDAFLRHAERRLVGAAILASHVRIDVGGAFALPETNSQTGEQEPPAPRPDGEVSRGPDVVRFFKGTWRVGLDGAFDGEGYWAHTSFGNMVLRDPESLEVAVLPATAVLSGELQGSVNLEDLDRAGVACIVANLLAGGYLSRPGIGEREDSLLFLLVNEAIHVLDQIAATNEDVAPVQRSVPAVE
ncbi:MAG: hypothetical protein AB1646_03300 [Thermodesulfobacteriota bacterium]